MSPYILKTWKGKIWTEVKAPQTIQRGGGKCFFCGSAEGLLGHHLINKPDAKIIAGWDTVCTCGRCHQKVCHNDQYWIEHPVLMKRRNRWWFVWWVRAVVLLKVFRRLTLKIL